LIAAAKLNTQALENKHDKIDKYSIFISTAQTFQMNKNFLYSGIPKV